MRYGPYPETMGFFPAPSFGFLSKGSDSLTKGNFLHNELIILQKKKMSHLIKTLPMAYFYMINFPPAIKL